MDISDGCNKSEQRGTDGNLKGYVHLYVNIKEKIMNFILLVPSALYNL